MLRAPLHIYRRRLPHWRVEGATYFVTWRIAPGSGDLAPSERESVAHAIRHGAGTRFALHAYVVMNDHVHVLLTPEPALPLQSIVRSWKSYTTRQLHSGSRVGAVWQAEYFDRIIRSEDDYLEKMAYIAGNPRKRWPHLEDYLWVWTESMGEVGEGGPGGPPPPSGGIGLE